MYLSYSLHFQNKVNVVICPQFSSLFQAHQIFYQPVNGVIQTKCFSFLNYFMIICQDTFIIILLGRCLTKSVINIGQF